MLSKAQILDHVWNYDFGGDANVVESYISYLRRKVDTTEPRLIHTLRGVGYVLRVPGRRRPGPLGDESAHGRQRRARPARSRRSLRRTDRRTPLRVKLVGGLAGAGRSAPCSSTGLAGTRCCAATWSSRVDSQLSSSRAARRSDDLRGRRARRRARRRQRDSAARSLATSTSSRSRSTARRRSRAGPVRSTTSGASTPPGLTAEQLAGPRVASPSRPARAAAPQWRVVLAPVIDPATSHDRRRRGDRHRLATVDRDGAPAHASSTSVGAAVLLLLGWPRLRAGPRQPAAAGRGRGDRRRDRRRRPDPARPEAGDPRTEVGRLSHGAERHARPDRDGVPRAAGLGGRGAGRPRSGCAASSPTPATSCARR